MPQPTRSTARSVIALAALSGGCGDARCPTGLSFVEEPDAAWCEDAAGVRQGAYEATDGQAVVVRAAYEDGDLHGAWSSYWPDGSRREEGQWEHGVATGWWSRWTEAGEEVPDAYRGTAVAPFTVRKLDEPHPDPAVRSSIDLGAPGGRPHLMEDVVAVPTTRGMVGASATTGEPSWEILVETPVAARFTGGGLRTAITWTEEGNPLVAALTDSPPSFRVFKLHADLTAPLAANDFGAVYVNQDGDVQSASWTAVPVVTLPVAEPSAIELAGERVTIGTTAGELVHWERINNVERWRIDLGMPPVDIEAPDWRQLYVSTEATVRAIAFHDGAVAWEVPLESPGPHTLNHSGTTLYVWSESGATALSAETGEVLARIETPPGSELEDMLGRRFLWATDSGHGLTSKDAEHHQLRLGGRGQMAGGRRTLWWSTAAGRLYRLEENSSGPPELEGSAPAAATSVSQGQATLEAPSWHRWASDDVGVQRVALDVSVLPPGPVRVEATWIDLTADSDTRHRTWSPGWRVDQQEGWSTPIGDGHIITRDRLPAEGTTTGWWHSGETLTAGVSIGIGDEATVESHGGETLAQAPRTGTPRRTSITTGYWDGTPSHALLLAWTEQPRHWAGWATHPTPTRVRGGR